MEIAQPTMGYSPKDLYFDEEARKKLLSGIEKIAHAVKSTLGPRGYTVIIESIQYLHGVTVTKDGVTVAEAIDLVDPVENLAVKIMKEAAKRTSIEAGDSTTTSIVLVEALIHAGFEYIKPEHNRIEVLRELNNLTLEVISQLRKKKKKVTKPMLRSVATIACNNDPKIGRIVADAYLKVGKQGIVMADKSQTTETSSEITTGIRIKEGYTSSDFITDHEKNECVLKNPYILMTDVEITQFKNIEIILNEFAYKEDKELLIIAPMDRLAIGFLAENKRRRILKICNIKEPLFGYRSHDLMDDIACLVGAKYFSKQSGDNLTLLKFGDLGQAVKAVISHDKTIITTDKSIVRPEVDERVAQLKKSLKYAKKKKDKDFILERIASLAGGIGVVFAGGNTDLEQKELYDRIDDAVCAVRSALEEGVVAGGGIALYDIDLKYDFNKNPSVERNVAVDIMNAALKAPMIQILENAGINFEFVVDQLLDKGCGMDVRTKKFGNMIDMGIIDPAKAVRCALENAVSVATTILSDNCIITLARSYETKN
jgi:chaperonin GroEL